MRERQENCLVRTHTRLPRRKYPLIHRNEVHESVFILAYFVFRVYGMVCEMCPPSGGSFRVLSSTLTMILTVYILFFLGKAKKHVMRLSLALITAMVEE